MRYDKRQAISGGWRVSESRLFLTALLGGAVGILLGMRVFRHKTKHWSFQIGVPLLLLLSILWMTAYSMLIEGEPAAPAPHHIVVESGKYGFTTISTHFQNDSSNSKIPSTKK